MRLTEMKKRKKHISITDKIRFNKLGIPKDHPFRNREFDGALKNHIRKRYINDKKSINYWYKRTRRFIFD